MSRDSRETEIKLRVSDANAARRILRGAGFRVLRRRTLEVNTVFDTPDQNFRQNGRLLRLREAGDLVTFTYKGQAQISKHKSREELEVIVSKAKVLAEILQRLGFLPTFRYEKYRTEWGRSAQRGIAMLDETPLGVFIELEGTPPWIDRTARQLGFAEKDYVTASYGRLYLDWCAQKSVQPCNMVF